ncbi:hypothetical protein GH714_008341 [Hevea brasiliensis]|uniref:Hexosyltransferase n=1 Tax=Hevea brasiliensis TaxID=3981 RepID=A0A6A6KEA2_HEVBR|nr:hypothetical protein GH714_008341 [Hevea brasiliensis]
MTAVSQQNRKVSSGVPENASNKLVGDKTGKQQDGKVVMGKTTCNQNSDFSDKVAGVSQQDGEAPSVVPETSLGEAVEAGETGKQQDGKVLANETVDNQDSQSLDETAGANRQDLELPSGVIENATGEAVEGASTGRGNNGVCFMASSSSTRVDLEDGMISSQLLENVPKVVEGGSSGREVVGVVPVNEDHHPQEPHLVNSLPIQPEPALAQDVPVPLNQEMLLSPSRDSAFSLDAMDFPSVSGIEHQPGSEPHITGNITDSSTQIVVDQVERSNEAVLEPLTHLAQHLPVKFLLKLRLKSDCEKEIEEVIAQIHRKYEIKLQEIESEFFLKKKELDTIHNKVLMNKILAEAFRSKCMDNKSPIAAGMQRDVASSFMQQLLQLSSQQTAQRNASFTGLSSAVPPTGGPQIAASSSHSASPSLQVVDHSSALFTGALTRTPLISSISPATVGMPSQLMPNHPPTASAVPSQLPLQPQPSAQQSHHPNFTERPETAGTLPALSSASLSVLELLMDVDNQTSTNSPYALHPLTNLGSSSDTLVPPELRVPNNTSTNVTCPTTELHISPSLRHVTVLPGKGVREFIKVNVGGCLGKRLGPRILGRRLDSVPEVIYQVLKEPLGQDDLKGRNDIPQTLHEFMAEVKDAKLDAKTFALKLREMLFPSLNKVVFLDDDIVVQTDLSPLWDIDLNRKVNGAVETCRGEDKFVMSKRFKSYLNFSHPLIANNFDPNECAWAYGMNIFDLEAWKKTNISLTYHYWVEQNLKSDLSLWQLGTLPPGLIAFHGHVHVIDPFWHILGLGYQDNTSVADAKSAGVIHFNGRAKPWLDIAFPQLRPLWAKYINFSDKFIKGCHIRAS